jgi:hypothetical protein
MISRYILIYMFLLPLQACTFSVGVSGRVYDKETGLPITGTTVNLLDGKDIKKTDNEGFFEVFSEAFPFQDPVILVTKEGYKPFQLTIRGRRNETSFIVTTESVFIYYEEPVYPDPYNRETFITGTSVDKWSKEFRTGDTLRIYLAREDLKAEVEKTRKEVIQANR